MLIKPITTSKLIFGLFYLTNILFGSMAAAESISAYLSDFSVKAGENLELYTSTSAANYDIEVHRVGAPDQWLVSYTDVPGKLQVTPQEPWVNGAQWQDPFVLPVANDWPSGVYTVTLTTDNQSYQLNFMIKSTNPGASSSILLLDNATTTMAYNNWGGKSLYNYNSTDGRSSKVSRLRPG